MCGTTLMLMQTGCPAQRAHGDDFDTGEIWFGVYMGQKKIGYQQVTYGPADYEGERVQAVRTKGRQQIAMMGASMVQEIESVQYVRKDGTSLGMVFDMASGGSKQHLVADFLDDRVEYTLETSEGEKEGTVPLPKGAKIIDPESGLTDGKMKPGDKLTYYQFVPILLNIIEGEAECIGDEEIDYRGEKVTATRVEHRTSFMNMTVWVDDKGEPLLMETPIASLRVVREPAEVAQKLEDGEGYSPPVDLIAELEIKTDKPVVNARQIRGLRLAVRNLSRKELAISDGRQVVSDLAQADGKWSATYQITTETPPEKPAALPIDDPKVAEYLRPTTMIQSDDQRLIDAAKEIVGDETDSLKAAQAVARWVNENMHTRADIGLVRSSLEVLESKEGVCRDYAALFAGLARAAGLPTRVTSGIVYWKNGFFYHAWDEVWVGKWMAFDATVAPGYPVDATHIKFAEGDVGSMIDMISVIGTIGIEIEEYH